MNQLSFEQFDAVYQRSFNDIWPFWSRDMQCELARHCVGWGPEMMDFRGYLLSSSIRFFEAYRAIERTEGKPRICDVGGFWGVWPLTLRELGFEVSMTESLHYYGDVFEPLFGHIRERGVTIYDHDPFDDNAKLTETFDLVTVMAVLEHYPHSLKAFMTNVLSMLRPGGSIYLEVPNIAYLPKRIKALFGGSPLVPAGEIYRSEVPFIGHHHEFTINELRDLAALAGLSIEEEKFFNYSPGEGGVAKSIKRIVAAVPFALFKETREVIAVVCKAPATRPK